jgi:transcriptional regulator with XRE-family HTH domain
LEGELPSAAQLRAARALLGWSQDQLASASGKARRTIAKFELGQGVIQPDTVRALQTCLEQAGVVFTRDKHTEGVHRRFT